MDTIYYDPSNAQSEGRFQNDLTSLLGLSDEAHCSDLLIRIGSISWAYHVLQRFDLW
jgi:hypothetical protein